MATVSDTEITDAGKGLQGLAERCEKAGAGEQRELLELTFRAVHGEKPARIHGGSDELAAWLGLHNPFFRMLDAEAYESAALTLVPEWLGVAITRYWIAKIDGPVWSAEIASGGVPDNPRRVFDCWDAATPALALTAAALRARAANAR